MPPHRLGELLEPVDLADHLDKLELEFGQVCHLAGISRMQLDYWTQKAAIPTKGRKHRIYDRSSVETVLLIKQARDRGLGLRAAIEATRRFQEEGAPPGPPGDGRWRRVPGPGARHRDGSPR